MFNPDKYLTVKWQMGGRVFPILDCYGLVHEVRKDLGLPHWPLFESVIKEDKKMGEFCDEFKREITPCQPQSGAVAACYSGGVISHLGVVVLINGELQVAESNPHRNITFMPLSRFTRRFQKVEYYT